MAGVTLSTLATFDDIRRCMQVLTDGTAEEEFLRLLHLQEKYREECSNTELEKRRIQKELDASLKSLADLETKLYHARRMLEMESKARREAECERDQLEKKMIAVAEFVQQDFNIKDETKEKLAFLNTLPHKRRSLNPHCEEKYGNDINSTGSFLSDLSITKSEDDFLDVRPPRTFHNHRPSLSKNTVPCVGAKRSRLSGDAANMPQTSATPIRRSGRRRSSGIGTGAATGSGIQNHAVDIAAGSERICATTKVTIPQDGNGIIRAESTIESVPLINTTVIDNMGVTSTPVRSPPSKMTKTPSMTPAGKLAEMQNHFISSPSAQQHQILRPPLMRQHNFASRTFIRADTCKQCQKKIRFGSVGLRCRDCPVRCHADCRTLLTTACVPQTATPTQKCQVNNIADYAPNIAPMIPALIVHCVNEIETRGLEEVGIYRVSGSEREVKALKERFLRGKSTPHLANLDIHVLCGCVKDFLRNLNEPLIPTNMWKDFSNAVQNPSEHEMQKQLYKSIENLPQPNRDTLAFLVLHLQRIAGCELIRMPIDNIARVFGPTVVGYSSHDPDQYAIFTEVTIQCSVMLNLLKIPSEYWLPYIALDTDKENNQIAVESLTPQRDNKDSFYSLYATPLKSTLKKRKMHLTPYPQKK